MMVLKGVVSIEDAIEQAQKASLDLVQVSPSDSDPVVCKLLDYGKHLLIRKNLSASKVKTKKNTTKEIKNLDHLLM